MGPIRDFAPFIFLMVYPAVMSSFIYLFIYLLFFWEGGCSLCLKCIFTGYYVCAHFTCVAGVMFLLKVTERKEEKQKQPGPSVQDECRTE